MTDVALILITCDAFGCDEHVYSEQHYNAIRRELRQRGWRSRTEQLTGTTYVLDYCPAHVEQARP